LDAILPHKEALETFFKNRLGELFGIEYDLLLYDVTSTYFAGPADGNPLAQRGYSRDHRPDCKQVCIGRVVSKCGMPLGYEVFPGNRLDLTTLQEIVQTMERRIEEGLQRIAAACEKQRQRPLVIAQRLGRLLGQNSRAAGLFHTEVKTSADGRASLHWEKIEPWRDWAALSEGCYLLRSNVTDCNDEELWKAYFQFTEAEAAFRIHKSDLGLRPIWHQKEDRVLAHILVCFLAYVLWKTLSQRCQRAGLGHEPRRLFEELGKIQLVDVVLPTRHAPDIRRRCVTKPTEHQAIVLAHLKLNLPTLPLTDGA
jgi:transposase